MFRIPFSALRAPAGELLISRHPVSVAPFLGNSGGSYKDVRVGAVVAVGNPATASHVLPRLPGAESEVNDIAQSFPSTRVLTGPAATRANVLSALSTANVVHFATHAVVLASAPHLSYLALAPEEPRAALSTLTAADVAGLKLRVLRLVVLASCESIGGTVLRGSGPVGLASAFLSAGVPIVIGSLWKVDDPAAHRLFRRFYTAVAHGMSSQEALRHAKLEQHQSEPDDRNWMAFELFGADFE